MEDDRLNTVETELADALNSSTGTYDNALGNNENLYNQQLEYADKYESAQNAILDNELEYYTEVNNLAKEDALNTKTEESAASLNDYSAFTNPYGVQAEQTASVGLSNSGYSETSKLGAYTTYQNRLSNANTVYQSAITQYDLEMSEAIMNNDTAKAENALAKLEIQLAAAESYTTTENELLLSKLTNEQNLQSEYNDQYNTVYEQIMAEEAAAESIRQWEEQMEYQAEQDAIAQENWEKEYALTKSSLSNSSSSSGSSQTLEDSSGSETLEDSSGSETLTGDDTSSGTNNTSITSTGLIALSNTKSNVYYTANKNKIRTVSDLDEFISYGLENNILSSFDVDVLLMSYK